MVFAWIVFGSLVAAFVSWHVAAGQGRNAKRWALATLLLTGLPLIWLIISRLFALPTFGSARRDTCCDQCSFASVADFDRAGGCDLELGTCKNCGTYLMAVSYVGPANHVVISDEMAEHFLRLKGTPELKKALKHWVD